MTAIEATSAPSAGPGSAPAILSAEQVSRVYTRRSRVFGPRLEVRALSSVSLDVHRNETVGVVGESGSGKTTLTRLLLGLERPNAGSVRFQGKDLRSLDGEATRLYRRSVAAVFQNPYSSLDPRMHIGSIVTEQLALSRTGSRGERARRASQLLDMVGLSADMAGRYPRQLSGGQRQRVAIARALACSPEAIILDEPISALDVSVRAQVINLLLDLQEQLGLAYVFVAHDLAIVRHMCHRVVVLYRGEVVERGAASDVLAAPRHPYTLTLLEASYLKESAGHDSSTGAGRGGTSMRKLIEATPESGCPYRLRCALASARCERESPALGPIGPDHEVACHHPAPVGSAKVGA